MQLPQPSDPKAPLNQQTQDFSLGSPEVLNDDTAVALVVQDTQRAEKFVMARLWLSEWRVAKSLYEAPIVQQYWRDTMVPRASNSFPLCSQHVRAILDTALPALFPEEPPFAVEPNEGTPRQVARAWEPIIAKQLKETGFKAQVRLVAKDAEVFGTGIGKWGWESFTRRRLTYRRAVKPARIPAAIKGMPDQVVHTAESDALDEVEVEEKVSRPFFSRCEINHVLVSPGLREPDIRKAQYVVYRDYLTVRDLNRLRGFEGYKIPPEAELIALAVPPAEQAVSSAVEAEGTAYPSQGHRPLPRYIDESEDPLEHKLEVLERWSNETVIVVLQRKVTIRNEDNPFGILPFVSCYWDDIPGTFYAFGIPRRIGSTQTHVQGLRNLRLDDVNLNLQNVWLEKRGSNIGAQPFRLYPGARFKTDDPDGLKPLIKQPILAEAYKEEAVMVADAERTSGANELLIQGAMPAEGRSSITRTAGGSSLLGGASFSRIQAFVGVIADQVFIPTLYAFLHMDRMWLEPADVRKLIGKTLFEELERDFAGDLLVDMCNNADIEFTMLAGSSLAARRAMSQALPLEMQMYMSPAVQTGLSQQGLKVNWVELSRRMEQATGWRSQDDVIVPLTKQDVQAMLAMNPTAMKGAQTQERIALLHRQNQDMSAQEHRQRLAEIDAKGLAEAGQAIITRSVERGEEGAEINQVRAGMSALGGGQ